MAYIEIHQALDEHPKTKKAARLAGVERVTMLGYLVRFWLWSIDYAPDGDLSEYSESDIEDGIDWTGEPGKFFYAICEAKFIDNKTTIHDWEVYGGKLLAKRQKDAERKREERSRTSDGRPTDGAGRIEESRVDKSRAEETAPVESSVVGPSLSLAVSAYESCIGIISQATGEDLKDLTATYPDGWVPKAIELAKGKQSPMPYIRKVLKNWQDGNGSPSSNGRHPQQKLMGIPESLP